MAKRTPFYELHKQANAKIVDFAGWDMPLHYGSQLEEHKRVRASAGFFDVSHMGIVDIRGNDTQSYLQRLLANDVGLLTNGKALYTCMLNDSGGILDDLIVYKISPDFFRIIVNAGTRDKDLQWMREQSCVNGEVKFDVVITERSDLCMLAVQGPQVKAKLDNFLPAFIAQAAAELKPFHFLMLQEYFIARTGYTGEDGYEMIVPADQAEVLWSKLLAAHISPCGLGARDTLRLEAGLNLYGSDMNEEVTPHVSNLGWTVKLEPKDRSFIGRAAIEKQLQSGVSQRLVGLILEGPGVMRNHQKVVFNDKEIGEITSGGFSPTLQKSIALARISPAAGEQCKVIIRDKQVDARVVTPPFVRHGKIMV